MENWLLRVPFKNKTGRYYVGKMRGVNRDWCTRLWNYVELFWNLLNNAPSSIVFYLEMKFYFLIKIEKLLKSTW